MCHLAVIVTVAPFVSKRNGPIQPIVESAHQVVTFVSDGFLLPHKGLCTPVFNQSYFLFLSGALSVIKACFLLYCFRTNSCVEE